MPGESLGNDQVSTHASVRRRLATLSSKVSMAVSFNSRLREEATGSPGAARHQGRVSTHASVRRRLGEAESSRSCTLFQLTPP